jgi:uncharacterized protein (DUF58 family)
MNFVFTKKFLWLFAAGALLFSFGWVSPAAPWLGFAFDIGLLAAACIDYRRAGKLGDFFVHRLCEGRFSLGAENTVVIEAQNNDRTPLVVRVKDEHPPELAATGREGELVVPPRRKRQLRYALFADARGLYRFGDVIARRLGPLGLVWRQTRFPAAQDVKVYPDFREAGRHELYARRNRELRVGQRRTRSKGQGREFESLREFVTGDEIRQVSWSASARRGKLVTREYQVERSQNIVVMIDCGRLMTARIERLTKLDYAINAALSIAYVATAGGDNFGLIAFSRKVNQYLPPKHGRAQVNAALEALYDLRPELIEPSYARAFAYLNRNCRKRSLVIILTDLVDRDASAELLAHTATLLPRHLPLIVTIGDRDLGAMVRQTPETAQQVYEQSVAEEMLAQRDVALRRVTELGGLALDVPTGRLSLELVNKYLDVKERGLL